MKAGRLIILIILISVFKYIVIYLVGGWLNALYDIYQLCIQLTIAIYQMRDKYDMMHVFYCCIRLFLQALSLPRIGSCQLC